MDLIERQAAIDDIKAVYEWHDTVTEDRILDHLHRLPPAQPERKKGRWIDDNCSECGQYVYHGDVRNFCPACGADMRGEQDE